MMTLRFRVILAVFLIIGLAVVINMIRKRQLELKYAISWLLLPIILFLIIIIPGCLEKLASLLGIYNVVNMVFFLGFVVSIIVIFTLTIALSRQGNRIRKLTQMVALDKYEEQNNK